MHGHVVQKLSYANRATFQNKQGLDIKDDQGLTWLLSPPRSTERDKAAWSSTDMTFGFNFAPDSRLYRPQLPQICLPEMTTMSGKPNELELSGKPTELELQALCFAVGSRIPVRASGPGLVCPAKRTPALVGSLFHLTSRNWQRCLHHCSRQTALQASMQGCLIRALAEQVWHMESYVPVRNCPGAHLQRAKNTLSQRHILKHIDEDPGFYRACKT